MPGPPGRHGETVAHRQAIVAVAVAQARGLPAGRPRPADVRDEQEAATSVRLQAYNTSSAIGYRTPEYQVRGHHVFHRVSHGLVHRQFRR